MRLSAFALGAALLLARSAPAAAQFDAAAEAPLPPSQVLVYPGQFDPFHNTHREELVGTLAGGGFAQALIVPIARPPDVPESDRAPDWLRLDIAKASLQGLAAARVDPAALKSGIYQGPALMSFYRRRLGPGSKLALLIGSDNYLRLASWRDVDSLLAGSDLVVNARQGFPISGDPLSYLPPAWRGRYRPDGPGRFVDPATGHWIRFESVTDSSISSWDVGRAVRDGDGATLRSLVQPAAADLILRHYYAGVDYAGKEARHRVLDESKAILRSIFGADLGPWLAQRPGLIPGLTAVHPDDPEAPAVIAGRVYDEVSRDPARFRRSPRAYSDAVRLALDPAFAALRRTAAGNAPFIPPEPKENLEPDAPKPRSRVLSWAFALGRWLKEASLPLMLLPEPQPPLDLGGAPGRKVRLYTGIAGSEDAARLKAEGLASKFARRHGQAAADAELARLGLRNAVLRQIRGDYKQAGVLISASLSPAVARAYARRGGSVVVSEVPVEDVVFVNDPQVWSGTVFHRGGSLSPEFHEALVRRLRPEWIVEVRAASPGTSSWREAWAGCLRVLRCGWLILEEQLTHFGSPSFPTE